MAQKKYSSSRQSSEIGKPKAFTVFSNSTNPINKTFMTLINLINSTFLSLKIIVDTLIDVGNCETSNIKINTTLFSNANVPVRLRAQQRAKYSSLQLTANCIAAERCLRHYLKLICESPTKEDTNSHRHGRSFPCKT